jgi:predicted DNA-binding protein with PD1-like motif
LNYTQTELGRIFILRLHQNECIHQIIEKFAIEKQITGALCFFLGGAENQSKVIVGPQDNKTLPPNPVITLLQGIHEGVGVGTIFCDADAKPKLHMHASFGRGNSTITGCIRAGVNVWQIGEVIILELNGGTAKRTKDNKTGFELLET